MLTPCMIMLTPLVAYFNKPTSVLVLRDLRPSVLVNKRPCTSKHCCHTIL